MFVVQPFGRRNHTLAEPPVPGFFPTNQQYRATAGVEGEECSQWPPLTLSSQLLHIRVARSIYRIDIRTGKVQAKLLQQPHACVNGGLLGRRELASPSPKIIRELNLPHERNYRLWVICVKGYRALRGRNASITEVNAMTAFCRPIHC